MRQRVIFGVDARALAGSAAVAAFATIALVAIWGSTPVTYLDTMSHLELARDLADGRLEAMPNAAPGYALVLILTRSADGPGVNLLLAQIMMCWLTIFFVLKLVSRYGASWKWLIVLTALMVAPPMMEPVFNATTETTATFLLVAGTTAGMCWYDSRRLRWLGAAGALFGLSALVRPSFQLVAVVLGTAAGIVVWRQRRSLASLAAVVAVSLAGTVVLVGGVSAYNGARFDYPGLTPLAGWHLMTRTGGFLDDIPDSDAALRTSLITLRNSQMIAPGNTPTPNRMLWRSRWQVEQATGLSPHDLDRRLVRVNLNLIARNPLSYTQVVGASVPAYMLPGATRRSSGGSSLLQVGLAVPHFALVALFWMQLWFVSSLPLARRLGATIRGAFVQPGTRFLYVLALGLIGYTLAISTMFDLGEPRYRAPADPLILVVMFAGLQTMATALRSDLNR